MFYFVTVIILIFLKNKNNKEDGIYIIKECLQFTAGFSTFIKCACPFRSLIANVLLFFSSPLKKVFIDYFVWTGDLNVSLCSLEYSPIMYL